MGQVLHYGHDVVEDLALGVVGHGPLHLFAARRLGVAGAKGTGAGLGGSIVALAKDPPQAKEFSVGLMTAGAPECGVAEVGSPNDVRMG